MNHIHFQPGLMMPEFLKQFGTEIQCEARLEQARWPQGFVCPCCAHTGYSVFKAGSHRTFQCRACRHQTSLIAGTIFQSTKLPLTVWFLAIYLISQAKTGLSTLALKRQLGVSYPTTRLIQHKIIEAMSERETTLASRPPSPSDPTRASDSDQLKPLDNRESIRSDDGDC